MPPLPSLQKFGTEKHFTPISQSTDLLSAWAKWEQTILSKSPQSLAEPNRDQSNPLFCEEVEDTITLSICMVPEPYIEHIGVYYILSFLSLSSAFCLSVCLFLPRSIPSGRAWVATAVGDRRGFGGCPVWGIKFGVTRGGGASCGLEHRQAPDVRPTSEWDKSKQTGQDSVMIGKTRRLCLK